MTLAKMELQYYSAIILLLIASAFAADPINHSPALESTPPDTSRAAILGPVHISKVRTMDEVKGSYKSPKKAMFMSLIIPGSGQLYVGGQSRNIRGVFYIAEELALITGLYYYSIYKYGKQVSKYEKFADTNFSVGKYEAAMNSIFVDEYKDNFQSLYGNSREDYCKAIYGAGGKCVPFSSAYDFYKSNYRERMPLYNSTAYYRVITDESFVLGWNDAVQNNTAESNYQTDSPAYLPLGSSANLEQYRSLRKKANDLADLQAIFLGAILLNHIVSAVDAALSAHAHNNSLYEEKVSFLDRVRPFSEFSFGQNFKAQVGLGFVW